MNVRVVRDDGARGRIVRCRRCSLAYLSPRPTSAVDIYADPAYFGLTESATSPAADSGYLAYAEDSNVMQAYFALVAHDLAVTVGQGRLVEVGAANGSFLRVARAAGFEVQGVEPGDAAAQVARDAGLPVITGTLDEAPLDLGAWDAAALLQTIEHLPHPEPGLARLLVLLKPGGVLLMTTPNQHSWLAKLSGKRWFEYKTPEHLFLFTPRTITALLSRVGFEQIEVRRDVHRYPPRWVIRRLGRYVPVARPVVAIAERFLPRAFLDWTMPVYYGSMRITARRPR